jgi:hypothetical protein
MHAIVAYVFELAVLGIGIFLLLASLERQTAAQNRDSFPSTFEEESQDQPEITAEQLKGGQPGSTHASSRVDDRPIDHPANRPGDCPLEVGAHAG